MFYPKIDRQNMAFVPPRTIDEPLFPVDAGSVEDDTMMLSGPAPAPPPGPPFGVTPWSGPYGHPVTEWTTTNGYPAVGYGGAPGYTVNPPRSWKVDVQLPDGWYTRISRRDKYS